MRGVRTIKSRASVRSRERHGRLPTVVGVPPVNTAYPEIYSGIWYEPNPDNVMGYWLKSAPGMTIAAFLGGWDETDGATTLVGRFHVDDSPVGQPGDTELLVTEEMLGSWITYSVTATRNGASITEYSWGSETLVVNETAYLASLIEVAPLSFQYWMPGQAITKPTCLWHVNPDFGDYSVIGEWWKNGSPTGVSTETYSDTQEGDIVMWIEKLVNSFGVEAHMPNVYKNTQLDYANLGSRKYRVASAVAQVVQAAASSLASRTSGLPGGATNMELFSTKDPVAASYTFNPDCWVADLFSQLSAIPVGFCRGNRTGRSWQVPGGWGASYGPTLITPRHVLTSGHTQFAAGSGAPRIPTYTLRWMLADGKLVEANVIGGNYYPDNNRSFHVSLLDRDVQAEGVHVMPAADMTDAIAACAPLNLPYIHYVARSQSAADRFGPGQEEQFMAYALGWQGNTPPYETGSDYPILHETMFWTLSDNDFKYNVWGGDSGTPEMLVMNDTVFLRDILSGGTAMYPANLDIVDSYIADCDALAVQRGVLSAPTGYTIKRSRNHLKPNLLLISESDPTAILISESDPTPLFSIPD